MSNIVILYKILLIICFSYMPYIIQAYFALFSNNNNFENNRTTILYDKLTIFQLFNTEIETQSLSIFTPQCMFDYSNTTCKKYLKIFLDANCNLYQTSKDNHEMIFYISPLYYNFYDSRFNANNITNLSWIFLPYSVVCQSNNICLFVVNFVLSYKEWKNVPIDGNNVTLICEKFKVYAFV